MDGSPPSFACKQFVHSFITEPTHSDSDNAARGGYGGQGRRQRKKAGPRCLEKLVLPSTRLLTSILLQSFGLNLAKWCWGCVKTAPEVARLFFEGLNEDHCLDAAPEELVVGVAG